LIGTFLRDIDAPTAKKNQSSGMADPVRFAREWLHFDPDERQAAVLRSTARRGILNCTP
jgi:hypothetical protein